MHPVQTGRVPTVDPEPWFRRQRDERLAELQRQLDAGGDRKEIRKEMHAAKWAYRRAVMRRFWI